MNISQADVTELADLLFAETKDPFDAVGILNVIRNRDLTGNKTRFGSGPIGVIKQPKQFTGYGSNEWKKVKRGILSDREQELYQLFTDLAKGYYTLEDTTGGADHYYNPNRANPKWAKFADETYRNDSHRYMKMRPGY